MLSGSGIMTKRPSPDTEAQVGHSPPLSRKFVMFGSRILLNFVKDLIKKLCFLILGWNFSYFESPWVNLSALIPVSAC